MKRLDLKSPLKMRKREVKMYFWYSAKQKNIMRKTGDRGQKLAKINRDLVEYSECNKRKKVAGLWDDYKYLGEGIIYSINGVLQGVR